jgi:hypothetical protein
MTEEEREVTVESKEETRKVILAQRRTESVHQARVDPTLDLVQDRNLQQRKDPHQMHDRRK